MLRTIIIGKKIAGVTQLTQQMVMSGDKIVLVDEAGHAPKHITTKMVGKDLHIFADGMSEPSAILNDYSSFENSVQIQGLDQGGAYYDYTAASGGMALSSTPVVAPVAAPTPVMSTSAWWGVGILAVAGGVAAAAGGGGGGGSSTTTVPAATTLTASLVDSLVSGVSYTTSSGLTGVTLADGSLTYKTGDIVTFKVGNATIGTFNTANINPDHIITIQEIAGVARTNTTDTKVVNIAQFLQSLDSDGNAANGITITPVTAALITTAIDVQTATDSALQAALPVGITLVTETAATTHLAAVVADTTSPTATITLSDSLLNSGETATVTITFSEAVAGFSNADVTVQNGTISTFASVDGGITWTAVFTPTDGISLDVSNVINLASTYIDGAGNAGTSAQSANYTVNTTTTPPPAPTLTISDDESSTTANIAGGSITYTFTFGDTVTGFTSDDITVTGGGKGAFSGSGSVYTLIVTPTAGFEGNVAVSVAAGAALGTGSAQSLAASSSQLVDMLAPTALTLDLLPANDTGLDNTDNITSSPTMTVSGITTGAAWEYSLNGGAWTSGTGTSFDLSNNTAYSIGAIRVHQIDAAGNISNVTSNAEAITTDTTGPKLTITNNQGSITANMDGSNGDASAKADGADILYTFKFNEVVKDFTAGDIVVTHGTAKTFTASPDGMTYTLGVTPEVGYEGNMTVGIVSTGYHDVAGNVGNIASDTSSVQVVDMLAPVLNDTVYNGTPTTPAAGDWIFDTVNRKIIFTLDSPLEAVNMATPNNFIVELNTKPATVSAVEMLGNTVTLIIAENFKDTESVRVVYKDATSDLSAAIQDLAGNDATSFTYLKPDVTPPTVLDIHFNNSGLSIGQSTLVTITFSEEVSDVLVSFQNGTLSALAPSANAAIWTATFTASADVEDLSSVFTTVSYHDLNKLANTSTTPYTYAVDTHSPGVSISDDEFGIGNIAGGTITYTFTFTEAVHGFTVGDVTVTGGQKAISFASGVDGDSVYTLIITPNVGFEGNVTVDVAGGKVFDTFGNPNIAADQSIQAVDMLALAKPTIALKTDSGFDTADGITNVNGITVTANASAARWEYSLNGGASWTTGSGTNFNIATNLSYVAGDIQVHQIDTAGNISAVESNTDTIIIDKTAPRIATTAPITLDGTTGTITIAMDSVLNPNDIAKENFVVNINGTTQTISAASIDGSNVLLYVPSFGASAAVKVSYADVSAADAFPSIKDLAGNNAVSFTKIVNDTAGAPTATITLSDSALKIGDTATVSIAFSEAVQNFANADVTVEGGTLGALSTSDNITWTATFTPSVNLESTANVITLADTYTDTTGVTGTTATSLNYVIDTHAPVVTISNDQLSPTANIAGGNITYTFTFDEIVTGFTASDITVVGGTKGTLSGSGTTYTLDITPTAGFEGNVTVDVAGAKVTDAAGNSNTAATQFVQAVDMKAPTLVISDDETATTANIAGGDITYTFTFSENVVGFTADSINVANGTKGIFSGSGLSYTLVVSPIMGSTTPISVDVPGANQVDIHGNTGANTTATAQAVDMSAPTAIITMSDTALKIGDTSTVTINFSEAVVGFSNADVTASNGTLGAFIASNGGVTWTATFTPAANIENTANIITLANTYTDVNFNTGTVATSSNYTVDTIAPTVTITNDQVGTANIIGGDILYTFTFSEAVTGFTVLDVAVVGGTNAAALVQTSATTYTLLVTPTGTGNVTVNIADGTTTGIADTAGNLSIVAFQSTQAVDMVAPTVVSVKLYDSANAETTSLTIGQTAAVKIVFSEAVSNFDNTDVSLAGAKGTLGTLTSADNITWTGLFTPTATMSDASNVIQVLNTYTDVASNNGTLGVSGNFAIDTRPSPVAAPTFHLTSDTSSGANNTDGITKTNGVTVTLATGITNWEYSLDGGTTWTTGTTVAGVSSFNLVENTSYAAGQIEVRQTDVDGNISTIATNTQTTIVDTIVDMPIINTVAGNDLVNSLENPNLIISGTGEAGATVTLAVANQTAIVDGSGNWSFTLPDTAASFGEGSKILSVTQTDIAGNVSDAGTHSIFIDTIAPLFVSAQTNSGTDSITLTYDSLLEPVNMSNAGNFSIEVTSAGTTTQYLNGINVLNVGMPADGLHVTLTLQGVDILATDTVRIAYSDVTTDATPAIQDLAGNDAASLNGWINTAVI